MKLKEIIALLTGFTGFFMVFISLIQGTLTGAVIGTNSTSKFLGIFGLVLMVIAIVVERNELKKD